MKDWIGQIAMNIVAAVVLAVFVMWFGIPHNTTVATFGAIYIAFALLTMFTRMPIDKIGLNKQVTSRYLLCSIGVFPVCFLLLRNGCSWDIEKAYAVVILLLYIGLIAVSIQSNTRTTSKLQTGFIGHAATTVCFRNDGQRLLTFLVFNKNHDMWLLPGGHLDIAHDDPSVVAKHRILSELGYDSMVMELDNIETKIFQSVEILRGCHAFYRIAMGPNKCHEIHFDFAYVCELDKQISRPKYENISVDVTGCRGSAEVASRLRVAIEDYYRNRGLPIPTVTFPPDIPDRIYAGMITYQSAKAHVGIKDGAKT